MSKLIYISNTSLDGYIEDERGDFNWVNPEHAFHAITELVRPMRTYLLGRRLYETMTHWDAPLESYPAEQRDFATLWQGIEKTVYSRTLAGETAGSGLRVERDFDPAAIRTLKHESNRDIGIGGAEIASRALEAGLLDECHLFINPAIVGGGKPAFRAASRRDLELLDMRRFDNGVVQLHYRLRGD